jgi:uncharacterized protein (DUF1697 family)
MRRYVVLLRAVMPSGRNKVPMAQLREVLSADGFHKVRTYIRSGNAIVETTLPARQVADRVHDLVQKEIGPDLAMVVRTGAQLRKVLDGNPFHDQDPARVYFVLFAARPPAAKVTQLLAEDFGHDEVAIVGDTAYLHLPQGYGANKLSNAFLEKRLGVAGTMRNTNTLRRLVQMCEES